MKGDLRRLGKEEDLTSRGKKEPSINKNRKTSIGGGTTNLSK